MFKTRQPVGQGRDPQPDNNQKLISWDTTVTPDPNSPLDANGLPTGYIQGPRFGQATSNTDYPAWRPGQTGGRTYLLSAGVGSSEEGPVTVQRSCSGSYGSWGWVQRVQCSLHWGSLGLHRRPPHGTRNQPNRLNDPEFRARCILWRVAVRRLPTIPRIFSWNVFCRIPADHACRRFAG